MLPSLRQEILHSDRSKFDIAGRVYIHIMASKETNTNKAVGKAVAEATRGIIQNMDVARAERTQNTGPRLDGPMLKQPAFNWEAEDKHSKLKNFILEVNNVFTLYSMSQAEQVTRKGLQLLE